MKPKAFLILLALLVLFGAGAFFLNHTKSGTSTELENGATLIPEFDLTEIASIEVTSGTDTNTVELQDGQWVIGDLYGYPADTSDIQAEVTKLVGLKTTQIVRGGTNPNMLRDLGLAPGEDANSGPTTVALKDAAGATLATLAIGDDHTPPGGNAQASQFGPTPSGQYVRSGDGEVYVTSESITGFSNIKTSWVEKELINVAKAKIKSAAVTTTNGSYTLTAVGENDYQLDTLKPGQSIENSKAYSVLNALSYLNFTEILDPATPADALGFDKGQTYTATSDDGLNYVVNVGSKTAAGDYPIRLSAVAMLAAAPTRADAEAAVPPTAEGDDKDAREKQVTDKLDELTKAFDADMTARKEQTATFTSKHEKWIYTVAAYKAEAFIKPASELTAEVKEDAPPAAGPGAGAPPPFNPLAPNPPEVTPKPAPPTPPVTPEEAAPPVASPTPGSKAMDNIKGAGAAAAGAAIGAGAATLGAAKGAADKAKDAGAAAADKAKDAAAATGDAAKGAADKVKDTGTKAMDKAKDAGAAAADKAKNAAAAPVDAAKGAAKKPLKLGGGLLKKAKEAGGAAAGKAKGAGSGLLNKAKDASSAAAGKAKDAAAATGNAANDAAKGAGKKAKGLGGGLLKKAKDAGGAAIDKATDTAKDPGAAVIEKAVESIK